MGIRDMDRECKWKITIKILSLMYGQRSKCLENQINIFLKKDRYVMYYYVLVSIR